MPNNPKVNEAAERIAHRWLEQGRAPLLRQGWTTPDLEDLSSFIAAELSKEEAGAAPEKTKECGECGIRGFRLYRPYANFYRPEDNRCNRHVTDEQRGYYVPLCDGEGGQIWGYTSVPAIDIDRFFALPEADPTGYSWQRKQFLDKDGPSFWKHLSAPQSPEAEEWMIEAAARIAEHADIYGMGDEERFAGIIFAHYTASQRNQPVDMLLFCPNCGEQHVDEAKPNVCETCGQSEPECSCAAFTAWLNPPHKSHRCTACNHVWRPADVATNGVQAIQTKGQNDSPTASQQGKRASVAGERIDGTLGDFVRGCEVLIAEEQEKQLPNNALIGILCDAVRLTREYGRLMTSPIEQGKRKVDAFGAIAPEGMLALSSIGPRYHAEHYGRVVPVTITYTEEKQ